MRVLFEQRASDGSFTGFTDNYIRVAVDTPRDLANRFAEVRITGLRPAADALPLAAAAEIAD